MLKVFNKFVAAPRNTFYFLKNNQSVFITEHYIFKNILNEVDLLVLNEFVFCCCFFLPRSVDLCYMYKVQRGKKNNKPLLPQY